jgi:hypothetical protein
MEGAQVEGANSPTHTIRPYTHFALHTPSKNHRALNPASSCAPLPSIHALVEVEKG